MANWEAKAWEPSGVHLPDPDEELDNDVPSNYAQELAWKVSQRRLANSYEDWNNEIRHQKGQEPVPNVIWKMAKEDVKSGRHAALSKSEVRYPDWHQLKPFCEV